MKKSVLVIDDDPDDLEFFSDAVSEISPYYECFTFSNGNEALEELKHQKIKPHFIFLDLNMPGMSGQDFLREIKKIPMLSEIPVIIWSTSRLTKEIEEVFTLGAKSYLHKPNSLYGLVETIKTIIKA